MSMLAKEGESKNMKKGVGWGGTWLSSRSTVLRRPSVNVFSVVGHGVPSGLTKDPTEHSSDQRCPTEI